MATSFSGGGRLSTQREPPTMGKQLVNFITCGLQYFPGCEPLHIRLIIFCSSMNIEPSSMSIDVAYLSNLPFSETKTCRV
jgi:hypothetical protein